MNWTVSDIKAKVRRLTGRPSTAQLSDELLLNLINDFYVHKFPHYVEAKELETFVAMTTAATDSGTYGLSAPVLTVQNPVTITDSDSVVSNVAMYLDPALFFAVYPDDGHDEDDERNTPEAVLFWDRSLYLRPRPDAVYTLKFTALYRRTAFVNDTDYPTDYAWGPLIAYGAALEVLRESGETEEVQRLTEGFERELMIMRAKQTRQIPANARSVPVF
jgi:hypothetical protein